MVNQVFKYAARHGLYQSFLLLPLVWLFPVKYLLFSDLLIGLYFLTIYSYFVYTTKNIFWNKSLNIIAGLKVNRLLISGYVLLATYSFIVLVLTLSIGYLLKLNFLTSDYINKFIISFSKWLSISLCSGTVIIYLNKNLSKEGVKLYLKPLALFLISNFSINSILEVASLHILIKVFICTMVAGYILYCQRNQVIEE